MTADTHSARIDGTAAIEAVRANQTWTIEQSSRQVLARIGAVAGPIGALILFVSTMLHPAGSHPNDHHAAFTEYAADSLWVWSHLGQFAGVVGLAIALVALALTFGSGRAAACGRIGLIGTAAMVTMAAALQAVDGVALKAMVDRWAATSGEAQALAFDSAIAVREIEVGLASFFSLVSGLTLIVFGLAIVLSNRYPVWLGVLGLLGGAGTLTGGIAQASTGFSDLAMTVSMPSSLVVILWVILTGVLMWRLTPELTGDGEPA